MDNLYVIKPSMQSRSVSTLSILFTALIMCLLVLTTQTSVAETDFDHDLTGFLLNGVHSRLKCESCHKHGIFKGTPKSCQGCHGQSGLTSSSKKTPNHVESSDQCDDCHTEISWSGARMDHVAITGSCITCHNGIKTEGKNSGHIQSHNRCDECHRTIAWLPARFDHADVTGTCFSCHNGSTARAKNANHIQSSNSCDDCHRTSGWIPAGFDHSNITATCSSCHDGNRAPGKNTSHVQSSNVCEDCHRTSGWIPATFDHSSVTGNCFSCHNGTTKGRSKPASHIASNNVCEDCHRVGGWVPATGFSHDSVAPGTCLTCHNGSKAQAAPTGHFNSSLSCDECHTTTSFLTLRYSHNTMGIAHNPRVKCIKCHTANNSTVTYSNAAYKPDCAGCHASRYKRDSHKKTETPETKYSVSELRDCAGSCHYYTDSTLTTIKERRNSRHRPTDGEF